MTTEETEMSTTTVAPCHELHGRPTETYDRTTDFFTEHGAEGTCPNDGDPDGVPADFTVVREGLDSQPVYETLSNEDIDHGDPAGLVSGIIECSVCGGRITVCDIGRLS